MTELDVYIAEQALTGEPEECGDLGFVKTMGTECLIALVDALGHGKTAHGIAVNAQACLEENYHRPVTEIITRIHQRLKGTRGAVAAVCRLNISTGSLVYSGLGNISIRILGSQQKRLMVKDGILGYMIPTPQKGEDLLIQGDLLVLSSDGIREHYDPDNFPDLFTGSAENIANSLIKNLGRQSDDASCIVLRYGI